VLRNVKRTLSEQVRALSSLLQRLQCGVALEALCESGSSFGTEFVPRETAGVGVEAGAEKCQGALTQRDTLGRRRTTGW